MNKKINIKMSNIKYQNNTVSIIIVNHNGKRYLFNCINSILSSALEVRSNSTNLRGSSAGRSSKVSGGINERFSRVSKAIEIIVFDNASTDNSVKLVEKNFSKFVKNGTIKIIKSQLNHGPAYARNIAVKYATGKYLNFLDNDTVVEKNWIRQALKCFSKDKKIAIIQCKLLLKSNKKIIDYIGEFIGTNGFLVQKAFCGEVDRGQYENEEQIMAAKSAGMFIRRDVFDKIGGFDDDYFIYVEETDLAMRVGVAGYKAVYCPKSIVYHVSGGSIESLGKVRVSFNSKFHGTKNYISTLIKNLEMRSLVTMLPLHIVMWTGLAFFKLITLSPKESYWIMLGIGWNIIYLPKTLMKRKQVQKLRKVSDKTLFKIWIKKVPFSYFFSKAVAKKHIGKAESY